MNIIVLAGGNSTEREVSIASGQGVCKALRERNHKAVLLDPYFGASQKEENLFPTEYDVDKAADAMREMSSKLEETMKTRKGFLDRMFWKSARKPILYFWRFTEQTEKTEKYSLFWT